MNENFQLHTEGIQKVFSGLGGGLQAGYVIRDSLSVDDAVYHIVIH